MDKAIHEIVSYEDSLCVLTLGGVLSILRRNRMAKTASEILQPLNTVIYLIILNLQTINFF